MYAKKGGNGRGMGRRTTLHALVHTCVWGHSHARIVAIVAAHRDTPPAAPRGHAVPLL